ncbi:MAG: hypothetical protein HY774_08510 [Acidobacteria bacterium]|nr:hypothetical protein [Acidobacteriota bacterium]
MIPTGAMAQNLIAFHKQRRSRFPTLFEPKGQQFIAIWLVVPHGNCRDGTQSG